MKWNWSTRRIFLIVGAVVALAGLGVAASVVRMRSIRADSANSTAEASTEASSASTSSSSSGSVLIPENTALHVRLDQAISSDRNRPGDHFVATVSEPVILDNRTVVPKGAEVQGLVVDSRKSGRLKGRARLDLALESVNVNGTDYKIRTASAVHVGGKHKKRNIAWIAGGGGGGALIGAIAAGGKGALIGGPIGAGAGTAAAFLTGKKDIHLRPETPLTFRLAEPVTVNAAV